VPRVSRWFAATALVSLVAGLVVGVVAAASGAASRIPALEAVRIHLLVVGWLTGLVVGVAHWLFPRRGSDAPLWVVYGLLYGGLLLRVVSEPARLSTGGTAWGGALVLSALAQAAALSVFAAVLWPRVGER